MSVRLYSAKICPFAQRSRMALLEKGLDFELIEVDLDNKSAEFLAVSPYGRVPALIDGDDQVYESAVINEYLEEVYPEPHLMPADPGCAPRSGSGPITATRPFCPTITTC